MKKVLIIGATGSLARYVIEALKRIEPLFPPIFAAVANAMYKATGQRNYEQPYAKVSRVPLS